MSRKSLGDLINTALSDADSSLKLASARDAEPAGDPGDFLAAELALPKVAEEDTFSDKEREGTKKELAKHMREEHKDDKDEKSEKKSSRAEVLSAAAYGMKLAQALEVGAHLVTKMSAPGASPLSAPGPEVMESGFIGAETVTPKAHANVSDKITGPTTTAGSLPTTIADHTGQLDGQQPPNNTGKTAGFSKDKAASARMLRGLQKQAEVLMRLGQTKAAEKLLEQVEKRAQDPSSPQPAGLPAHSDSFRVSTEPGESSHIPDNAGLISMTKAQAKDQSVRAATQHISETPKVDNAVAAHTLRTDGLKVSSAEVSRAYLERAIKVASDPHAVPAERVKAAGIVRAVKARHQALS